MKGSMFFRWAASASATRRSYWTTSSVHGAGAVSAGSLSGGSLTPSG